MKDSLATVEYKEFIGERYFRLGLKVGWDSFAPGQFVMLEVPGHDILLRRPFGIVKIQGGVLEVCVKVVGKGTAALSKIEKGQQTSVLGPLGKGFELSKDVKTAILVAGGYGIAPLLSLAKSAAENGANIVFYYGAKKSADLLYMDELKSLGVDLRLATEDGSAGEKGFLTQRLEREILEFNDAAIFCCGPRGLLNETAKIAAKLNIQAQVSLESYMACGIGVCLGCAVKVKDGSYVRACREGPVFDAANIIWE